MLEEFDPRTIEDESLRQVAISLMNLVEQLSAKVAQQAEEIQRLRDENNRLKGEQGKPNLKAHKHAQIRIDRVEVVKVDEEPMPADAQFKGYEDVIVQDIALRTEN